MGRIQSLSKLTMKFQTTALLFLLNLYISTFAAHADVSKVIAPPDRFQETLALTRELMTRPNVRKIANETLLEGLKVNPDLAAKYGYVGEKLPGFTETQMMMLLEESPETWPELREYINAVPRHAVQAEDTEALKAAREYWKNKLKAIMADPERMKAFLRKSNPTEPYIYKTPDGSPAYKNFKVYVSHPTREGNVTHLADDLESVIVKQIKSAKREIIFNVFDFDLMSIADALIERHNAGVVISGGIDSGVISVRPEVKAVYDKLIAAGIAVHAVDSVGLNHQKLIAMDWSLPGEGRVVMSSGNFTKSCISPRGDAAGTAIISKDAIPNANHVMTLESNAVALTIHHDNTKTTHPDFRLRGSEYPLTGAIKFEGATTKNGKKWITLAFTPNGGLDNVNKNIIGRVLRGSTGPIYMAQFAFSSKDVEAALLERAERDLKTGKSFKFFSVGDTPFAMQDWSVFLSMSGFELIRDGENPGYKDLPKERSAWKKLLTDQQMNELRENIRIAPPIYGTKKLKTPNGTIDITAKIHHKLLITGELGHEIVITGSFNFSQGAESNQEYIMVTNEEELASKMKTVVTTLSGDSPRSVYSETIRKNKFREIVEAKGTEVEAGKASRSTLDGRLSCKKALEPVEDLQKH